MLRLPKEVPLTYGNTFKFKLPAYDETLRKDNLPNMVKRIRSFYPKKKKE